MSRTADVLASLKRSRDENHLHHAYIFSGIAGTGKKETIKKFAASCFTSGGGLFGGGDEAEILQRIERSGHPDLCWIRKVDDEKIISVEQVRELHKTLAFAPLEAEKRFVVIEEAECLNAQASNAILKILEEPPSHTVFFLSCRDAEQLLSTIRSRCQMVRFFPLSAEQLEEKISAEFKDVSRDLIKKACALADGSWEFAQQYLQEEEMRELFHESRQVLLEHWKDCPKIGSKNFKFLEKITTDEHLNILLHAWESFLRDAILILSGADKNFYDEQQASELKVFLHAARGWTAGKLEERHFIQEFVLKPSAIHRMRVQQQFHVNKKAAIDNLLCELQLFSIGKMRQK